MSSIAIYEPGVTTLGSACFGIGSDGGVFTRRNQWSEDAKRNVWGSWLCLDSHLLADFLRTTEAQILTINGATYYRRETTRLKLPGAPL